MSRKAARAELIAALNLAMRDVSGQGVLYSQAVAQRLGITATDLECLDLIARGPVSAGALAGATGLTTGAITGVIDRLEGAGLATRESDPDDRRKVLVQATAAVGRKVVPLYAPMERAAMAALNHYGDEDLARLLEFLHRSRDAARAAIEELQKIPKRE